MIGAVVQPLVFWLLVGSGFRASFRPPGVPQGTTYAEYAYPGILAMVLLFTAIFATISVVEDRRAGFLQGVLVAPVSRGTIVLGQALGCTALALLQGVCFLLLAPVAGVPLSFLAAFATTAVMALLGFGLSSLGLAIAWRLDSTQGFHAIMNLVLLPMWVLSGAFFPSAGVPGWMRWAMASESHDVRPGRHPPVPLPWFPGGGGGGAGSGRRLDGDDALRRRGVRRGGVGCHAETGLRGGRRDQSRDVDSLGAHPGGGPLAGRCGDGAHGGVAHSRARHGRPRPGGRSF